MTQANDAPEASTAATAVATRDQQLAISKGGVELRTLEDLGRFAEWYAASKVSKKWVGVSQVVVAVQTGLELGLSPMRALDRLFLVNGRIGMEANDLKAVVEASGVLRDGTKIETKEVGTWPNADYGFQVRSFRKDWSEAVVNTFTIDDAKRARLWDKSGPWKEYPKRMLRHRAVSFHIRDEYGDVILGLRSVEELRDIPPDESATPGTVTVEAPPARGTAAADPLLAAKDVTPSGPITNAPEPGQPSEMEEALGRQDADTSPAGPEASPAEPEGEEPPPEEPLAGCSHCDKPVNPKECPVVPLDGEMRYVCSQECAKALQAREAPAPKAKEPEVLPPEEKPEPPPKAKAKPKPKEEPAGPLYEEPPPEQGDPNDPESPCSTEDLNVLSAIATARGIKKPEVMFGHMLQRKVGELPDLNKLEALYLIRAMDPDRLPENLRPSVDGAFD